MLARYNSHSALSFRSQPVSELLIPLEENCPSHSAIPMMAFQGIIKSATSRNYLHRNRIWDNNPSAKDRKPLSERIPLIGTPFNRFGRFKIFHLQGVCLIYSMSIWNSNSILEPYVSENGAIVLWNL